MTAIPSSIEAQPIVPSRPSHEPLVEGEVVADPVEVALLPDAGDVALAAVAAPRAGWHRWPNRDGQDQFGDDWPK